MELARCAVVVLFDFLISGNAEIYIAIVEGEPVIIKLQEVVFKTCSSPGYSLGSMTNQWVYYSHLS